jgi:hypothetical protein
MNWKFLLMIALIVGGCYWLITSVMHQTPANDTPTAYVGALKNDENKAQDAAATANVQSVQEAVNKYKTMKNENPASLQDLVPDYIDHIPGGLQYDSGTGIVSAAQ